jgi:integrase
VSGECIRKSPKTANFQYRRRVPLDVQKAFGKKWVERSLNTADAREAKKRAALITSELDHQWDVIRGSATPLQRWRQGSNWLAQQPSIYPPEYTGEPDDPADPSLWASDEFARVQDGKAKMPPDATPEAYTAWLRGETDVEPPTVTLKDALKLWTEERKPTRSVRDGAARVVEQFRAVANDTPLHLLTRSQARRYRDSLAAAGTAPGTIETYLSYLRTIFENAMREELVPERSNPFAALKIERTKAAEEERLPIPRAQCLEILKTSLAHGFDQSDWFAAALLTTGARPGGLFRAKLDLHGKTPHWQIPREKKSPPRIVPLHPMLITALDGTEPPKFTVRVEQLRKQFIERWKPHVAYSCRHSFNDEARRISMPLELRLRLMGQSARRLIGENARYGSIEAVLQDAPQWIGKMWQ